MIHKAVVVLGALAAGAAGWASHEFVWKGWTPPERVRLRGGFRGRGGWNAPAVAPAAPDPAPDAAAGPKDAPVPKTPAAPPRAGTAAPAAPAAKAPPAAPPKKAEPPAPPAPKVRRVTDVKLPQVANGRELAFAKMREVHVDLENAMTWHGEDGQTLEYKGTDHLGKDLRDRPDAAFVIVADEQVAWAQVVRMIEAGQNNYATNTWLGVARKEDPEMLRALPIRPTERSDEPLPEGAVFRVVVESKKGAPQVSIDGKKVVSFPTDLAIAWNEWKKAHPDLADTSVPEKTRVVLEAPKTADIGHVAQVIDVLRGIGIQTERIAGVAPMRKMK